MEIGWRCPPRGSDPGRDLVAAIWTPLQGILLTAEALGFFIAAMMLMPKVWAAWTTTKKVGRNRTAAPHSLERPGEASGVTEPREDATSTEANQALDQSGENGP